MRVPVEQPPLDLGDEDAVASRTSANSGLLDEACRALVEAMTKCLLSAREVDESVEKAYVHRVPGSTRKMRGQFFTPPRIAELMTRWVFAQGPTSMLEPAAGLGVFVRVLASLGAKDSLRHIVLYEKDPVMCAFLHRLADHLQIKIDVRCTDFLLEQRNDTYDAIVGNPPYIRHHDLDYPFDIHERVERVVKSQRLSRLTNIYGLFIMRCANLLSDKGRGALITPSEYLNAEFGVEIKRYLIARNLLDGVIVFDHKKNVFSEALTTAAILLLKNGRALSDPVRLIHAQDLSEHLWEALVGSEEQSTPDLRVSLVSTHNLNPKDKWHCTIAGGTSRRRKRRQRFITIAEIARTKRGIATGANWFFTLSREEAEAAGIRGDYLTPCIAKASWAPLHSFTEEDFAALDRRQKKIFLLNVGEEGPDDSLVAYLELGKQREVHLGYLASARKTWYTMEKRTPAPILAGVFGRGRLRFVLNTAQVLNLTAFHGIYLQALSATDRLTKSVMAYLISDLASQMSESVLRVYGDGLLKVEPRDLLRLPVPDFSTLPDDHLDNLADAFDRTCEAERQGQHQPLAIVNRLINSLWT